MSDGMPRSTLVADMAVAVCALATTVVAAQTPAFDVASVRENRAGHIGPAGAQRVQVSGGTRAHLVNVPLRTIVAVAFRVNPDDVEGGPAWVRDTSFDIDARVEQPVSAQTMRLMLQALLRERFGLVARETERPMKGVALVLAKPERGPGPNLRRADRSCRELIAAMEPCGTNFGPDHWNLKGVEMGQIAVQLGSALRQPLFDGTGLDGLWNFDVHWTRTWRDDPSALRPEA
ncbi:MAG: TIGR03435 family protein, partial [Vicinamibacterales bacterium]